MPNTDNKPDQEPDTAQDNAQDSAEDNEPTAQAGSEDVTADQGPDIDTPDDSVEESSGEMPQEENQSSPQETIENLEADVADLNDRLLRAVAETENVRRRAQRDKEDMAKYAISNFSRDMLAVADNLRRALNSVDDEARKSHGVVDNLMIGVEMTERELLAAFERTGIKRMDPIGQRFDPNVHEAMFEYEDADIPAGSVGQVIEPGYMLHSRALRPAKVGVTRGGGKANANPTPSSETKTADTTPDGKAYEKQADSTDEHVGEHINEEF